VKKILLLDFYPDQRLVFLTRSHVGKEASSREVNSMIRVLERVGRILEPVDMKSTIAGLPDEVVGNKEKISRFLLLTAILDQQAESPTARKTAVQIRQIFRDDLFYAPGTVMLNFQKLVPLEDEYKISPAIGRVLPKFGWIVLRVGAFLMYEIALSNTKLSEELRRCERPREALDFLYSSPILESVLREKAVKMYISWIGHPDLGIDLSHGRWRKADFEMPVDGHVGKIFSRTGMIREIIHEAKKGKNARWNIISASDMRPSIQAVVNQYSDDCIMVDHGAFRLGINCCPDNLEGMACDSCPRTATCMIKGEIDCPGVCPLSDSCKRNLTWRAY